MPYKDPELRKACSRESKRKSRSGASTRPPKNNLSSRAKDLPFLEEIKVQRAQDLLDLLAEQINEVRFTKADELAKARCVGYLISVGVRLIETRDLQERVRALEEVLKARGKS